MRRKNIRKHVFAATGRSVNNDPYLAGKEAVEKAIKNSGKKPEFGLVFCSGGKYGQDYKKITRLVKGAHDAFMKANPKCKWVGCTTAGEISSEGFSKNSCVAMSINSEYLKFGVGIGENVDKDVKSSTKKALKQATKDLDIDKYLDAYMQFLAVKLRSTQELISYHPYHILTLCPGPTMKATREDEIVAELKKLVGPTVPITGGSAADDLLMNVNYTFANGKVYKDALVLTTIVSHVKIATTAESGFKPTKKSFVVTKAKGRLIHELNNRPAAEVLAEAYNSTVEELSKPVLGNLQKCFLLNSTNPLLIVEGPDTYRVAVFHMIKGKDVIIGSGVAENTAITIGKGSEKTIINSASTAMKRLKQKIGNNLAAIIAFDCDLRLMALGDKIHEENRRIMKEIGKTPIIGFFTNGEQCFIGNKAATHVNYTLTAIGISNNVLSKKDNMNNQNKSDSKKTKE